MRRSGVRIPLAPPQADIRSGCRFLYAWARSCGACCCVDWCRWCSGRSVVMLCGALPLCVPVGGGPPARRPRCELRSARRLEARPGPAAAHGHRSQALPPTTGTAARPCRRPQAPQPGPPDPPAPSTPAAPGVLMVLYIVSRPGQAPPPPPVLSVTRVKPSSPLLAGVLSSVKPTSPLRGRYTRFRRYFIEQRRRGFHGGVLRLPHWCSRFHIEAR